MVRGSSVSVFLFFYKNPQNFKEVNSFELFFRGPSRKAEGTLLLLFSFFFFFFFFFFFSAKSVWAAKTIRPRNTELGKLVANCTRYSGNTNQTN